MKASTTLCLAVAALTVRYDASFLPQASALTTSQPGCRQMTTYKGTTTCVTSATTSSKAPGPWDVILSSSTTKAVPTTTKASTTTKAVPTTTKALTTTKASTTTKPSPTTTTSKTKTPSSSATTKTGTITTTRSTLTTTTKARDNWTFRTHFTWSTKSHSHHTTKSYATSSTKSGTGTTSKTSPIVTTKFRDTSLSSTTSASVATSSSTSSSSSKGALTTTTMTTTASGSSLTTSSTTTSGIATTNSASISTSSPSTTSTSTISVSSSTSTSITSSSTSFSSSSSATSSSTSTDTGSSTPKFKLSVQVPDAKLFRRFLLYLSFSGDQGYLVNNAAQGTDFTIVNGYLMVGNQYVITTASSGSSAFSKSSTQPTGPGLWSMNGGQVSFSGAQSFCYTSDLSLFIVIDTPPAQCTTVSLAVNRGVYTTTGQFTTTTQTIPQPTTTTGLPATTGPAVTTSSTPTSTLPLTPWSSVGSSQKVKQTTSNGQSTYSPTTTSTTTSSISCTEQVYTATSRCKCTWSVRCNSYAVSEFGENPTILSATNAFQCIELCNNDPSCAGLYFEPRTSNCYIFDAPGDNVLYGYNTGPYIAASPLICDASCDQHLTTRSWTTTSTTTTASVPSGICTRAEEYQAHSSGCNCVWQIGCGTNVHTTPDLLIPTVDAHACCDICDSGTACNLFIYDPYDGNCRIWYDASQPAFGEEGYFAGVRLDNWCPKSQCPPGS